MAELAGAMFGFLLGGFVWTRFLYWIGCLWIAIEDWRTAVAYPHLGRNKRWFVFLPLVLLHSGPWAVAVAIFVIFELVASGGEAWHFWFVGGFLVYVVFMCAIVLLWMRRRKRLALQR